MITRKLAMLGILFALAAALPASAKQSHLSVGRHQYERREAKDVLFTALRDVSFENGKIYACECVSAGIFKDPFSKITTASFKDPGSGIFAEPFMLQLVLAGDQISIMRKKYSERRCGNSFVYCKGILLFRYRAPKVGRPFVEFVDYRLSGGTQGVVENVGRSMGDLFMAGKK